MLTSSNNVDQHHEDHGWAARARHGETEDGVSLLGNEADLSLAPLDDEGSENGTGSTAESAEAQAMIVDSKTSPALPPLHQSTLKCLGMTGLCDMVGCNNPTAKFAWVCDNEASCNAVMHQECIEDDQDNLVDRPPPGPGGEVFCCSICRGYWNLGPAEGPAGLFRRISFQARWRIYDTYQAHFGECTPQQEGFRALEACLGYHLHKGGKLDNFLPAMQGKTLVEQATQVMNTLPADNQADLRSAVTVIQQMAPPTPPQAPVENNQAGGVGS